MPILKPKLHSLSITKYLQSASIRFIRVPDRDVSINVLSVRNVSYQILYLSGSEKLDKNNAPHPKINNAPPNGVIGPKKETEKGIKLRKDRI